MDIRISVYIARQIIGALLSCVPHTNTVGVKHPMGRSYELTGVEVSDLPESAYVIEFGFMSPDIGDVATLASFLRERWDEIEITCFYTIHQGKMCWSIRSIPYTPYRYTLFWDNQEKNGA